MLAAEGIDAATVAENLLPIGNIPATESQARPLASLEPEVQQEVWREAVEMMPAGDTRIGAMPTIAYACPRIMHRVGTLWHCSI